MPCDDRQSSSNQMEISALLSPIRAPAPPAFPRPLLVQAPPASNAVLVFGFPPGSANPIIDQFESYGVVVSHSIGHGNWVRLEYTTRIAADQALQQDGKVVQIPGAAPFMIGVKPASAVDNMHLQMDVTRGAILSRRPVAAARNASAAALRRYGGSAELDRPRPDDGWCNRIMSWITNW
ncbi:hypothetical protein PBRA_000147 [Plasmodiophora brassicae]|nr:hypothetical protein PBRA_000147 [Plasmodiophora brassicae]